MIQLKNIRFNDEEHGRSISIYRPLGDRVLKRPEVACSLDINKVDGIRFPAGIDQLLVAQDTRKGFGEVEAAADGHCRSFDCKLAL